MTTDASGSSRANDAAYRPPQGKTTRHELPLADGTKLVYDAHAQWMIIRKRERPLAEMFHVAYLADQDNAARPLTFVFNGGPGAASAYLHMGAVGPKCVAFSDDGRPLAPPTQIVDNPATWLAFTDLVFIDPVGTGFSRGIDGDRDRTAGTGGDAKKDSGAGTETEFFAINRDLESLCDLIRQFLSAHHRWTSPIFIAGESYGGFRAAKLARLLQERYGVGLNGCIIISPALEFALLDPSDYDVLPWVDTFPTMALAAAAHGRCSALDARGSNAETVAAVRARAEAFAADDLTRLLVRGDTMPERERNTVYTAMAAFLGLRADEIARSGGRIRKQAFARRLLEDERRVVGLYDASMSVADAFPDRDQHEGPDASLAAIDRIFAAGINTQLRHTLALDIDRDYLLLNFDVNRAWKLDYERHVLQSQIGATDDLRYGLQLNPHMRVRISHGVYDLVTPYFTSERIAAHMKLDAATRARVELKHYAGGHMFYTWKAGREAFAQDMQTLYRAAADVSRASR